MEKINLFLKKSDVFWDYILQAIIKSKALTNIKNHINLVNDFWKEILPANDFAKFDKEFLGCATIGIITLIFILLLGFTLSKVTSTKFGDGLSFFIIDFAVKMISVAFFWVGYWGLHIYTKISICLMIIGIIIFLFWFIPMAREIGLIFSIVYTILSTIFINLFYLHIIVGAIATFHLLIIFYILKGILLFVLEFIADALGIDKPHYRCKNNYSNNNDYDSFDWTPVSNSNSNSGDDDHWYNQRGTVHDEYDNDYKVGTSGEYVEDKNGKWRKVHHYSNGDPYIEDDDGNNIDLK